MNTKLTDEQIKAIQSRGIYWKEVMRRDIPSSTEKEFLRSNEMPTPDEILLAEFIAIYPRLFSGRLLLNMLMDYSDMQMEKYDNLPS